MLPVVCRPALLLVTLVLPLADLAAAIPQSQSDAPGGLTSSDWSSINGAYDAGRHAVRPVDGGYRARNAGQQWTTEFDGLGFTTTPDAGDWSWGLQLQTYGWGDDQRAVATPQAVTSNGQTIAYDWDEQLTEWYVNDARGLEHGYIVHTRPPQDDPTDPGPLIFTLAVRGGLTPEVQADGRGVRFLEGQDSVVLTYSGLKVIDADGQVLPAHFAHVAQGLLLSVDQRGARYPLTIDPIAQQAYLKAFNTNAGDGFGTSVAVSGDTVVVGAFGEDSSAMGVDGDQSDNSAENSGAVYVFVRNGTTWGQQAYLKASNTDAIDSFGSSVAVAGDTIVVGAPDECSNATGVNGDGRDNSLLRAGAAYVFVRTGVTWSQQAYLKASNTGLWDKFGYSVALSGDTLVVGAIVESSSATGVNGDQSDNSAFASGAAYVFVRSGAVWSQQAYLKASNTEADPFSADSFGVSVAVSGDTVLVGSPNEDSHALGVNGDQNDNSAASAGAAYVFGRNGASWSQEAYLKASNADSGDWFGWSVAVSGIRLVVGAPREDGNATGSGAAYIFVRAALNWSQEAYLKASNTEQADGFGVSVGVSGNTVVVAADREDSSAIGVNGDQSDNSADNSGAAYVFVWTGTSWNQQAYLKASNTEADPFSADSFGRSVAVSGNAVVVGAPFEDSNATGVGGDQGDDSASGAGAAYVFDLGPWDDLGGGTVGVAGQPVLTMSGLLTPSSFITLDLVDGAPLELALVLISFTSSPTPFLGGILYGFPFDELVIIGTDTLGEIHGSASFPGAAAGQGMWFQVGIQDLTVPTFGASLSNGVKGTVP